MKTCFIFGHAWFIQACWCARGLQHAVLPGCPCTGFFPAVSLGPVGLLLRFCLSEVLREKFQFPSSSLRWGTLCLVHVSSGLHRVVLPTSRCLPITQPSMGIRSRGLVPHGLITCFEIPLRALLTCWAVVHFPACLKHLKPSCKRPWRFRDSKWQTVPWGYRSCCKGGLCMVSAQIALWQQSLPCRMLGVGDAEGAAVLHSVLPNLFGMQQGGHWAVTGLCFKE